MREIKFRGKRIDNGEWIYGYYVVSPVEGHRIYFQPFDYVTSNTYFFVFPESVGQYTGLNDKNGTEIYEGDICKHNGGLIAQIVFWEGAFIFNKYYIHDYSLSNFAPCRTFEVIGNIHNNPELIS